MEHAATEEHSKDLLRINLLLESVLAEATTRVVSLGLTVAWLLSCHVVDLALLRISETSVRGGYFLERVCRLWRLILVGMQLDG